MLLPQLSNLGAEEEVDIKCCLGVPPGKSYGLHKTMLVHISVQRSCHHLNKLTNAISLLAWEDCGLENHASRPYLKVNIEPVPDN